MTTPITLLFEGQAPLFALLLAALVLSLTCHEFGHAFAAYRLGDDTAKRAGRLTLNPLAHIDPFGLLMVVLVGIGYAKPVPVDERKMRFGSAGLWVAAAGPAMNLLLAVLVWNGYLLSTTFSDAAFSDGVVTLTQLLVVINLVLMVFNLLPIGPLDGHYILAHLLPARLAFAYLRYNARFGAWVLMGLVLLHVLGVPVFAALMRMALAIVPWITFVNP